MAATLLSGPSALGVQLSYGRPLDIPDQALYKVSVPGRTPGRKATMLFSFFLGCFYAIGSIGCIVLPLYTLAVVTGRS